MKRRPTRYEAGIITGVLISIAAIAVGMVAAATLLGFQ